MSNHNLQLALLVLILVAFTPTIVMGETIPVFTPVSPTPVLSVSQSWEASKIYQLSVMFDQGQYKAWYSAGSISQGTFIGSIGYATSNDGVAWSKYSGNPVLSKGSAGFDSQSVSFVSVLKVANKYYMYYRGYDGSNTHIGLATSNDGITWTKDTSNPLFVGTHPDVVFANNQWSMWYDVGGSMNYATSQDGKTWTQVKPNVVPPPLEVVNAFAPSVLYVGGVYHMWFTSDSAYSPLEDISRLYYATSTDGINWTVYPDKPISGAIDVGYPSVVIGSTSYMWFNKGNDVYLASTTTPVPEFGGASSILLLTLALAAFALTFVPRISKKRLTSHKKRA